MKKCWILILMAGLCGMAQASLEARIDLGAYDQTGLSGNWNTVGTIGGVTNLVDWNTGLQTTLGIINNNWTGTAGTDGWKAGQNLSWVNEKAANDYLFMASDFMDSKTATITLYGLTDGTQYRLELVSSENYWAIGNADIKAGGNWASSDYQGKYTSNIGQNWNGQTAYNDSNWLIWDSVYSSSGSIALTVTLPVGFGKVATVNALRVEAVPEPASVMMIGLGGLLIVGYRRFYGRA
ncbi:MAG: PEP-CTERM sorting domain-containing protein [Kiritimatiellales bacterium]